MVLAANRAGTYWHALGSPGSYIQSMPVEAGETIFRGACVMQIPTAGGIQPAADTAGGIFAGVALENIVNSGADGAVRCLVYVGPALILLTASTALAAGNEGLQVAFTSDNTFDILGTTTNDVIAGRVMNFVSTTSWWTMVNASARA